MSRNFAWLPYHPGHVTLVPFQANMNILTGWMSGCWLALVSVGGASYFAHVGTETNAQHPSTIAVKNGIKIAIGAGVMTVQRAFQMICQGSPNTLGCVSVNRHFYTLGLSMSPTSKGAMKMRIDSKTRIVPQPGLPSGY
ncbi:hypothetical protein [Thetidibacter halocola]|uniref:Uncharacterized protein n=1 Tax=Thetidibacter halocola TaxID=2827239 RepID=A0A8J7WFT8_9RHOB|nr:hypothetical protein [Thetidibacter halocola]MBS0124538.1 hypothetical protein [Thetidibacter halocola]